MENTPQSPQPLEPQTQPPELTSPLKWWVMGGVFATLLLGGFAWGYWNITSSPSLSSVCCATQPNQEYRRDDEHVYVLYSWQQLSNPDYEANVRAKVSEVTGTSYEQNEALAVLENVNPHSFRIVGRYLADDSAVYGAPLRIGEEIVNGEAEYAGMINGIAVLRSNSPNGRWYNFNPVESYEGWIKRDLVSGNFEYEGGDPSEFLFGNPDPTSFTQVSATEKFYKDKDYVYEVTPQVNLLHIMEYVDATSFEFIGYGASEDVEFVEGIVQYMPTVYTKDKDNVYVDWAIENRKRIQGADPATFEVVSDGIDYDAQDKNHKYLRGEIVE